MCIFISYRHSSFVHLLKTSVRFYTLTYPMAGLTCFNMMCPNNQGIDSNCNKSVKYLKNIQKMCISVRSSYSLIYAFWKQHYFFHGIYPFRFNEGNSQNSHQPIDSTDTHIESTKVLMRVSESVAWLAKITSVGKIHSYIILHDVTIKPSSLYTIFDQLIAIKQ